MTYHERLEQTLLLIAEARERAEAAARTAAAENADDELLTLHRRLLEEAVLSHGPGTERQLALDAA